MCSHNRKMFQNKASTRTTTSPRSLIINKTEAPASTGNGKQSGVSKREHSTVRCGCDYNGLSSLLQSLPTTLGSSNRILDINNEYGSLEQLLDNHEEEEEEEEVQDEDKQPIDAAKLLSASLSKVSYISPATSSALTPAAKSILSPSKRKNVGFVCDDDSIHHSLSSSSSAKQDSNIHNRKKKRMKFSRRNSVVILDNAQLSQFTDTTKNAEEAEEERP
jgi:hypothetical protein